MTHPSFKRLVAVACAVSLAFGSAAQAADLSQQMADLFGGGALSNATGPGAYRSQTQNIYMGGEMQLRFPSKYYQFWSLSLPSVNAGCGGVDAYLGSFSHINRAQFTEMLKQVAASYAGLLFKAALKSINPLIESVIGDLQKTLESVGQSGASTCAMAQALLNSTSEASGMSAQNTCETLQMEWRGMSRPEAQDTCRGGMAADNAAAASDGNAAVRDLADKDVNLVWEALSQTSYTDDEKHTLMNIAGTVVIFKPANHGDAPRMPVEHGPGIDSLNALLFGDEPGTTADEVKLTAWLSCDSATCLAPSRGAATVTPFPSLVRTMLQGIRDAVVNRKPLSVAQIRFINMTRVPVYRMMAVGYRADSGARRDHLIDLLIDRYAKVIAYDYAWGFMRRALKDVRLYCAMLKVRNRVEDAQVRRVLDNIDRMLEELDREHTKAQRAVRDANAVVEDLQRVEREMTKSLPGTLRGMLDMGSLLGGRGGAAG